MIEFEDDDTLHTMLFARIETLQAERDALAEENERMRKGVKTAQRDQLREALEGILHETRSCEAKQIARVALNAAEDNDE